MKQESDRIVLKAYQSPEHPEMKWAVSGPAEGSARRWRKLFVTREEAEEFLLQSRGSSGQGSKSAPASPPSNSAPKINFRKEAGRLEKRPPRVGKKRGVEVRKLLGLLALIGVAFFVDRMVRALLRDSPGGPLLSADFEANPLLAGWIAAEQGVDWTTAEHQSGARSLMVQGGDWTSPLMRVQSASWYRVGFASKSNHFQDKHGRCTAIFVGQDGQEICAVTYSAVARLSSWQPNEIYVQSPRVDKAPGESGALQMRIRFPGEAGHPLYIDDVVVMPAPDREAVVAKKAPPDAAELLAAQAEFTTEPLEQPIFGETFRAGSVFDLQGMMVQDGEAVSAPGRTWPQLHYAFPEWLDLKDGDLTIYWAYRADPGKGEELGTLYTYLNFTDPPPGENAEPARITVQLRSHSVSNTYADPGWEMVATPKFQIIGKPESFPNAETLEKFRLRVQSLGGDAVVTEVAWWNRRSQTWEGFVAAEQPNQGPLAMHLDVKKHLLGHTSFRSLALQVVSDVPRVDTVLITRRPPRKAGADSYPANVSGDH